MAPQVHINGPVPGLPGLPGNGLGELLTLAGSNA
jgi:hypothetical protein